MVLILTSTPNILVMCSPGLVIVALQDTKRTCRSVVIYVSDIAAFEIVILTADCSTYSAQTTYNLCYMTKGLMLDDSCIYICSIKLSAPAKCTGIIVQFIHCN